ncbi:hypothetical protein H0H87_012295, partial [Tephrocybe sp. NHM501043]
LVHFKKNWPANLQDAVIECIDGMFKEHFPQLDDSNHHKPKETQHRKKGMSAILHELSNDESEIEETGASKNQSDSESERPWSPYIDEYINMVKNIPDGWSSIKWWGVNNARYHPILASPCL